MTDRSSPEGLAIGAEPQRGGLRRRIAKSGAADNGNPIEQSLYPRDEEATMATMNQSHLDDYEDPLDIFSRALVKFHSVWLKATYPFAAIGTGVSIHYSCSLYRSVAKWVKFGSSIVISKDVWLNVLKPTDDISKARIVMDDCCAIGRRCQISAKNSIHLERDVILSPSVLIMDHSHAYEDVTIPIRDQGTTGGGTIRIGHGCWIGHGAAIVSTRGELVLGHNCVVGANSVVTRSFPPCSVISGNPARIVKQFDPVTKTWVLGSARSAGTELSRDTPNTATEQG